MKTIDIAIIAIAAVFVSFFVTDCGKDMNAADARARIENQKMNEDMQNKGFHYDTWKGWVK